ncbi:DUF2270 domain-containing protein [Natrialba asiatica]|uniref:DUF2270 domain-containing protein n=1 Tax=Natrialba asiatica (strain ATCC 700177 / DSM 12278 / JCM 9576 / FERM P-10747 / NBRC 102637 / 172P1) TaxID=29540 RepID=M0APF4_NATA1|nr:DUF2270 domain-containing protein [Natrialba asiatica]ELY99263.1 hypothetical protein C481_15470 [Natrialba asiatica DSM 12278]
MSRENDTLDTEHEEVAAEAATDSENFLSLVPHYYRGEVSQATSAQDRLDRTTDWAITLIAALLSLVFSSEEIPAYLLLVGLLLLVMFLFFEVRRYRFYDVWRARVRLMEENVFANAFDPTGAEHPRWREEVGEDLRQPTFKVSFFEALSRRVRRVYALLFAVVGVAWASKITLFTPEAQWTEAAELPGIPGIVVVAGLAVFYAVIIAIAVWPAERRAKGEIHGVETGDWKDTDGGPED